MVCCTKTALRQSDLILVLLLLLLLLAEIDCICERPAGASEATSEGTRMPIMLWLFSQALGLNGGQKSEQNGYVQDKSKTWKNAPKPKSKAKTRAKGNDTQRRVTKSHFICMAQFQSSNQGQCNLSRLKPKPAKSI